MRRDRAFWLTALGVSGVVLFALFVRAYWNVEAATPAGTFVLSESDAYFHRHSVERVQTEGWSHPIEEPLVNYPVGGINPNPPLWTWWIAVWGSLLTPAFGGDATNHPVACPADAQPSQATCVSTWWVTLFSPALFGALTVFVVVLLGRELGGWRAGLLAGFLAATSTAHIERSVLGFADHDSFVLFFIVLSFLFLLRALQAGQEARWVERWGSLPSVRSGLLAYARANQLSLAYAVLAGVALAGVGLAWKGSAYAAGIMLVFGLLQVVANHWRQRDSLHVFAPLAVTQLVGLALILPYYANPALQAVADTLFPLLYIALAWLAFGLLFVAMRDYPFVLVLPAAGLDAALALVAAFLFAPSVAQSLLAPLVYFRQTKLYTTIAEAHPADFNTVVFGTGVAGFFLALAALPWLFWSNRKSWRPALTFVGVWGLVAVFMTHSAVRFMFNATPAFALLGGWAASLVVGRLRFEQIGRNLAGLGGLSREALRRSIGAWHVLGALLLAAFLVLPNVILAVDAGMPAQFEDKLVREELQDRGLPATDANRGETFVGKRFGAFGQGFIADYWRGLFEWLATQDTELPEAQRPAFLSWWDYGHWALSLGRHPAVADNFQNGFQFAGDFIAAQNETHATQLLLARIYDRVRVRGGSDEAFLDAFRAQGLGAAEAREALATISDYANPDGSHGYTPLLGLEESTAALAAVEARTGERIRYFAVDVRLFPFDNPQTPGIDFGSIFYAPITLGDHDPDSYVEAVIRANVRGEPKTEFNQSEWDEIQRDVRRALNVDERSVHPLYKYREPFFNSMFYRAYIGTPVGLAELPVRECIGAQAQFPVEGDRLPGIALPGFCLEHWRLVYYDQQVRMLKYYPGARLEGQVLVDGQPVEGARVLAFDDAGDLLHDELVGALTPAFLERFRQEQGRNISARDFDVPHQAVDTDRNGTYSLVLPFSTTGNATVRAFVDGVEVGSRSFPVSAAQAEAGASLDPSLGLIEAESGSVGGKVFFDADRNGVFGAGDEALGGARVSLEGAREATTGPDGTYRIEGVPPGRRGVTASLDAYEMARSAAESIAVVRPGEAASLDVPMALRKASLEGAVWLDRDGDGALGEGEGVERVPVRVIPDFRDAANTGLAENPFTGANGTLAFAITPGSYVLRGERVNETGSGFAFGLLLDVARGEDSVALAQNDTLLRPATRATLNLTIEPEPGNVTGAAGAEVLFLPTQGGMPAAERAAPNGTLSIHLVPGSYEVFARASHQGGEYRLAEPLTLVVGAEPVKAEGRLVREA